MMMVIDASVMACWYFPDERNAQADAIFRRLDNHTARVPAIWWFEIRNVLLNGERRGRTTPATSAAFLEILAAAPIDVAPIPDEHAVFALARRHRLSFYDAAYLELAVREKYPLATFDNALRAAAEAETVPLL